MAARTIDEALTRAICTGPAKDVLQSLRNELKDFIGHEIMRLQNDMVKSGASEVSQHLTSEILMTFFDRLFKGDDDVN